LFGQRHTTIINKQCDTQDRMGAGANRTATEIRAGSGLGPSGSS
jgi:hypothetical protein